MTIEHSIREAASILRSLDRSLCQVYGTAKAVIQVHNDTPAHNCCSLQAFKEGQAEEK